jgi:hypothetical protein
MLRAEFGEYLAGRFSFAALRLGQAFVHGRSHLRQFGIAFVRRRLRAFHPFFIFVSQSLREP